MLLANDTELAPDCLDRLLGFDDPSVWLWSGISINTRGPIDPQAVAEGADFSCVMFRADLFERVGTFDERFRPAYFEDNDYYLRVVLAGGKCRCVGAAQFVHHGSGTIRLDPEAAHHCRHWFEINRRRYLDKWRINHTMVDDVDVLANAARHPWGDESLSISFWDR